MGSQFKENDTCYTVDWESSVIYIGKVGILRRGYANIFFSEATDFLPSRWTVYEHYEEVITYLVEGIK